MPDIRANDTVLLPETTLKPHPTGIRDNSVAVSMKCRQIEPSRLLLEFCVNGKISNLKFSRPKSPMRSDGLWRTTCFELFLRNKQDTAYTEINLAPSSAWAIYTFDSYRTGGRADLTASVESFEFTQKQSAAKLEASVYLPTFDCSDPQIYIFEPAVILEDTTGIFSFWARRHHGDTPDFHRTITV